MRRQVAEMFEINDGLRPFAPQYLQPPPAYQNSRQMPQWPQPSAASNRSSDSLSSTQVPRGYDSSMGRTSWHSPEGPPPSWAAPRMNFNPGLPPPMYSPPHQWPGADMQAAAGRDDTATERPQGQEMGLEGCHGSRMYGTTLANFRMGQVHTVRHLILRTARHTWRCKTLR